MVVHVGGIVRARRSEERIEADLAVVEEGMARGREHGVAGLLGIARARASIGGQAAFAAASAIGNLAGLGELRLIEIRRGLAAPPDIANGGAGPEDERNHRKYRKV
jgi:hypothetical protein